MPYRPDSSKAQAVGALLAAIVASSGCRCGDVHGDPNPRCPRCRGTGIVSTSRGHGPCGCGMRHKPDCPLLGSYD